VWDGFREKLQQSLPHAKEPWAEAPWERVLDDKSCHITVREMLQQTVLGVEGPRAQTGVYTKTHVRAKDTHGRGAPAGSGFLYISLFSAVWYDNLIANSM
jgi:hypothetical protein